MVLHSQVFGEGKPFLILHGFLGMGDNWKSLGGEFSEVGYRVHLLDQRNHGRSFHSEEFNYELMAEDVIRYCDHYGLHSVVLLGHSMGGKTAMEVATKRPDLVSHLIVADIAPKHYPQHHQDILKGLSSLDFTTIQSRGDADEALSKYISVPGIRQFLLKNLYWVEKGKLGFRMNLPVLTKEIEEIGKSLEEDARFNGPTLFLAGSLSGYIQKMDELSIHKHFPNAKIETVSNAGHWLHAENPKEFYDKVMSFLG